MRIRRLRVSADFLVNLCKGGGPITRCTRNALPADACFVQAGHDGDGNLNLLIASAEFEDVPDQAPIPEHPAVEFSVLR